MSTPFTPDEVIFAPTARCNLHCAHCRVNRDRGAATPFDIDAACVFIADCAANGVMRVGFSGGEPFLAREALYRLCAAAVDADLLFDRLMTNADWYRSGAELDEALTRLADAGFDGTIGLSVDDWHGQEPARLARFIRAAGDAFGSFGIFDITSVRNRDGSVAHERLAGLARDLGAKLEYDDDKTVPVAIVDDRARKNRARGMDDGSGIDIPIQAIPYSPPHDDGAAWEASAWFADDWCAGPGNVLYVHPDGAVAVCCGFANERDELIAGHISEGAEALVAAARGNAHVRACYETGLGAWREKLSADGIKFPGKTGDICQFCDWLCVTGHAAGNGTGAK